MNDTNQECIEHLDKLINELANDMIDKDFNELKVEILDEIERMKKKGKL